MAMNKKEKSWGLYKRSEFIREGETSPYLIRYNLFECPWFSIKIHKIMQSDNDCPHDHPWAFWSFILKGGYFEWVPMSGISRATKEHVISRIVEVATWYPRWSLLHRPANHVHRLELEVVESRPGERYEYSPTTTLVVTFKKSREWGFWTKKGWVPWTQYKGLNKCD